MTLQKPVRCPHCGASGLNAKVASVNSFIDFVWRNLRCKNCLGYYHWGAPLDGATDMVMLAVPKRSAVGDTENIHFALPASTSPTYDKFNNHHAYVRMERARDNWLAVNGKTVADLTDEDKKELETILRWTYKQEVARNKRT